MSLAAQPQMIPMSAMGSNHFVMVTYPDSSHILHKGGREFGGFSLPVLPGQFPMPTRVVPSATVFAAAQPPNQNYRSFAGNFNQSSLPVHQVQAPKPDDTSLNEKRTRKPPEAAFQRRLSRASHFSPHCCVLSLCARSLVCSLPVGVLSSVCAH